MSIAPPSDIVLDVAQAADPTRLEAATARLAKLAAGAAPGSVDFNSELASVQSKSWGPSPPATSPVIPNDHASRIDSRPTSPYQKFEAMVLQNFMEAMLPTNTDLFGDAASADACRSMLADQLATQLSKSGKLGIAKAIETARGAAYASGHAEAARAAGALQASGAAAPASVAHSAPATTL